LKAVHFFRRVPSDVSEGTVTGGFISLVGAACMVFLFFSECYWYMAETTSSRVVLDTNMDQALSLHFNVSLLHLPCKFASVDIEDRHGNQQVNITGDVTKYDISPELGKRREHFYVDPDDEVDEEYEHPGKHTIDLDGDTFQEHLATTPFTAVTFFSITPECELSQMWVNGWETVALSVKQNSVPGEIHMASINCSHPQSVQLCKDNGILGTPAIRVYHGTAEMKDGYVPDEAHTVSQMPKVETDKDAMTNLNREYHGHRMVDLVSEWILSERKVSSGDDELDKVAQSRGAVIPGCEISGVLQVTRAPGNFHLACHSELHTFDVAAVNTTHKVHAIFFGNDFHPEDAKMIASTMAPGEAWPTNPLAGRQFVSDENVTVHHYLKVLTTRLTQPVTSSFYRMLFDSNGLGTSKSYLTIPDSARRAYQYTAARTRYQDNATLPSVKFSWDLEPIQVVLSSEHATQYRFGSFVTSLCAMIGGVFAITGIFDAFLHHTVLSSSSFKKKFNKPLGQ